MKKFQLRYKKFGAASIVIEWPELIDDEILDDIISFQTAIKENLVSNYTDCNDKSHNNDIIDIVPAYNSLTIFYLEAINDFGQRIKDLNDIYQLSKFVDVRKVVTHRVPVCYEHPLAADSSDFLKEKKLSSEELIKLHTQETYRLGFLGFLPGFLYLSGLNKKLYCSRKGTPSLQVPKGAVAIGGQQTGIYPQESPGGWHVIGLTPMELFNPILEEPSVFYVGDLIQFYSISVDKFESLKNSEITRENKNN